jgi:hypothetical protein
MLVLEGGKIIKIDIKTGKYKQHQISDASIWDIIVDNNSIYAVNTNGELLEIDGENMKIVQKKKIHKKNIYSLMIYKNILYTSSQDKALIATDNRNFETVCIAKNAINNMSKIIGVYNGMLIASNPDRNEITAWNIPDIKIIQTIQFQTGGLNNYGIIMSKNTVYGSNNDGVYKLDLENI